MTDEPLFWILFGLGTLVNLAAAAAVVWFARMSPGGNDVQADP